MSTNDGGDPIRLSREPVAKPDITRGYAVVPNDLVVGPIVDGGRVTFSNSPGGFCVTYHDVEVVEVRERFVNVDIAPSTVITWERVSDPAPQI